MTNCNIFGNELTGCIILIYKAIHPLGQANHFIADDRKSFGSVSLKRNEESNEEIKKRKEEFKEKQNEQDDFAVDKNKEQSEMDQMVVVLKEEGIKTDFNQLCTNKEPNPKDRVEGLNVPFPTL